MADQPQRIYSNFMSFHGSAFEATMDFGSRAGDEEPTNDVRIVMSWVHLKLMVAVLQRQIEEYEQQMGTLPDLVEQSSEGGADG